MSSDLQIFNRLSAERLPSRLWRFTRGDGTEICPRLRLTGTGQISGLKSAAEAQWQIREHLEFCDSHGRATTAFTSIGQAPDGCLELSGAFLPDRSVTHRLTEIRPLAAQNRPVAVMVRAHNPSEKLYAMLDILSQGEGYDLFLAADETRRPLEAGAFLKVAHSEGVCADLDLMATAPVRSLLWYFGDYAFYGFHAQHPNYAHYVMIEYDVGLARQSPLAVEALAQKLTTSDKPLDLVAPYLHRRDSSWMWSEQCLRRYTEVYGLFFPIVVLSQRALIYLLAARRAEAANPIEAANPLFCESFVPSALADASDGFRCVDLRDVLTESYEASTFRGNVPMIDGFGQLQNAEFSHPAFSIDEYLDRLIASARDPGRCEEFHALLGGLLNGELSDNDRVRLSRQIARLGAIRAGAF